MATYKVIQDIEAEDKLLGPLTLRQFVYAAVVAVQAFIVFKLATVSPFFILPFLPSMIFFSLLAAPFGHDQSSEVWLLAKIRFFLKPRRRIWDQSGLQELVTITVPKKIEKHLTDGLNPSEVKSRLRALANTIDSRGWAVKNINVNMYSQPSYMAGMADDSDRLIEANNLPQEVPAYEVYAHDDILDETNNPTAQHLDAMINQSEQSHRQTLLANVQNATHPAPNPADNYLYMNSPVGQLTPSAPSTVSNSPSASAITTNINPPTDTVGKEQIEQTNHQRAGVSQSPDATEASKPIAPITASSTTASAAPAPSAATTNPVIARLSNNDDLNVATIAREAHKSAQPLTDEVVVSLR